MDLKSTALLELSQELCRFNLDFFGKIVCPTCLKNLELSRPSEISEEHIFPDSVGGKLTTILCKPCNSMFGSKQTRWLGEYVELYHAKTSFHPDEKKQSRRVKINGIDLGGTWRESADGSLNLFIDRKRTSPENYTAFATHTPEPKIQIEFNIPLLQNENLVRVGFLTSAYGLWFKNFGYSWVFQSAMEIVRKQIQFPDQEIMNWNYLIDLGDYEAKEPWIGLAKFNKTVFPCAAIFDHLVLLPSSTQIHPEETHRKDIYIKQMRLQPLLPERLQHRCVGPTLLRFDEHLVIFPDMMPKPTIPFNLNQLYSDGRPNEILKHLLDD